MPSKIVSFIKSNPVIIIIVISLVAIVSTFYYKDIQGNKQKHAIEKLAQEQLLQTNENMLRLVAKPLIWGIRTEMLRGNLEQVNLFLSDLVKEKNFQFIHLVDPTGNILISTDKKLEGQSATTLFADSLLHTDSIKIINNENQVTTLLAPVMGFDKKLGTLIFNYATPAFVSGPEKETSNKQ